MVHVRRRSTAVCSSFRVPGPPLTAPASTRQPLRSEAGGRRSCGARGARGPGAPWFAALLSSCCPGSANLRTGGCAASSCALRCSRSCSQVLHLHRDPLTLPSCHAVSSRSGRSVPFSYHGSSSRTPSHGDSDHLWLRAETVTSSTTRCCSSSRSRSSASPDHLPRVRGWALAPREVFEPIARTLPRYRTSHRHRNFWP